MPPVLTPEQTAQLQADKAAKTKLIETLTNQIAGKQEQVGKLAVSDSAFKAFFDYYNTDIIGKYEAERRAIDGKYIAAPITESDILGPANIDGSVRTTPSMPATDVVRVDEFDGGPLVQQPTLYEQLHIADQAILEDRLVNGFPFTGTLSPTTETSTSVDGSTTEVELTDDGGSFDINVGDYFVVVGVSSVAVLKATAVEVPPPVEPPPMTPEPSTATITVEVIVPPIGTIAAGAEVVDFNGFNNTERTNKVPADLKYQPLMDFFVLQLNEELNNRLDRMDEELVALNANQDPNTTQAAPISKIQTSTSFIESYVSTMDISDTGLASLANERSIRSGDLSSRITELEGLKAAHYDARYEMANNRANTSRGTLRLQKATEASLAATEDFISGAEAQIAAINSLV